MRFQPGERLALNVLIEKSEDIVFPCRNVFVQHIVAVVGGQTYFGIDFRRVWFVEAFQFFRQCLSGSSAVVVLCMASGLRPSADNRVLWLGVKRGI